MLTMTHHTHGVLANPFELHRLPQPATEPPVSSSSKPRGKFEKRGGGDGYNQTLPF